MYNDGTAMPGENIGETYPNTSGETDPSARASEWDAAMRSGDVVEFQGEWGYGEPQTFDFDNSLETPALAKAEGFNQNLAPDQQMAGASHITSYGFDTASRVYGLNTVLSAIYNTDITPDAVGDDPLNKIYEVIEPRPEGRAYLYREIQKDLVTDNEQNNDPSLNTPHEPLGITPYGEFYDKNLASGNHEQNSIDAIKALKKLLDTLATSPRFQNLRDRAVREDKSIIDVLVGDTTNPTITTFLNGVGGELPGSSVEEVLDEIAEEEVAKANSDDTLGDKLATDLDGEPKPEDLAQTGSDDELDVVLDATRPNDKLTDAKLIDQTLTDDELADEILNRLNRDAIAGEDPAIPRPREVASEFLTDDEFKAILRDEEVHLTPASEFDSAEIIERLKRQVPPDFEDTKSRPSSEFPTDLAA